MAHSLFGHPYCTLAGSGRIGAFLTAVPCRHDTGRLSWRRPNLVEAYVLTLGFVAVATLVRVAVDPYLAGTQFPTFFLAAILSTFVGGICAGLFSVVLSTFSAYYFLPHLFTLVWGEAGSLLSFIVVATLMVFIIGSLQAAHATAQEAQGRTIALEERARVAEELRLWSDVFHHAAFAISVVDAKSWTIRSVNEAYAAIHAMSVDGIEGKSVLDLYPPHERERVIGLQETADRNGYVDYNADHARSDGSTFPSQIHITSVRGVNGDILYRISTLRDITEQRELEKQVSQNQRLEAIGQLTAGVSHDFNNLLQAMMANLELIDDDAAVPPATQEKVLSAIRLAEQGAALTQQLLSFARKQLLSPRKIVLGDYLNDFHSHLLSRTLDPRIRIGLMVQPGLAPVWADETHLRAALLNIAINARDAMPSGGDLRIEASRQPATVTNGRTKDDFAGFAVIRISDTGTGITPENLTRVCDPFFSTKGLNGTGLGLSMVHGFVKQSGGDLHIKSEWGKGTCVEVLLPLAPAEIANSVSV